MKVLCFLLISVFCISFCPETEEIGVNSRDGFYIHVQDFVDRTDHSYILDTTDSVNTIFNSFFNSELELGNIDRPITIYNGKFDFYVARVTVFEKPNGKKSFKHLKYPKVYTNRSKMSNRSKLKPVIL